MSSLLLLVLLTADPTNDDSAFTADGRYALTFVEESTGDGESHAITVVDLWSRKTEVLLEVAIPSPAACEEESVGADPPRDCAAEAKAQQRQLQQGLAKLSQWRAKHRLARGAAPTVLPRETFRVEGCVATPEGGMVRLSKCPTAARTALLATLPRGALESQALEARWSPDFQHVLLRGEDELPWLLTSGYAQLDLLEAKAPERVEPLTQQLTKAGYPPAHTGKATGLHRTTELFFAPAFEAEARALGAALKLPPAAIKPLTWSTRYALTLVAAPSPG